MAYNNTNNLKGKERRGNVWEESSVTFIRHLQTCPVFVCDACACLRLVTQLGGFALALVDLKKSARDTVFKNIFQRVRTTHCPAYLKDVWH